ncbi:MAG: transposase [Limisphaerales bacterium]
MARPIRIERTGGWYHITARGNERRAIYRDDRDRRHFCELLEEMVSRFNLVLHAFVMMDNHYHLLVELREANLSRAVQWLNVSYSVWFNRRHQRSGHLFQGRYRSVIVDAAQWGLGLSRYVHLNPVRIGKLGLSKGDQQRLRSGIGDAPDRAVVRERTAKLRGYRWSSYRAYAGLSAVPEWLECGSVLSLGGGKKEDERRNYRAYVEHGLREGLEKIPWEDLKERVVLGSQEFVAGLRKHLIGDAREQRGVGRLKAQRPEFERVIQCVEEVKGEKWGEFRDRHADAGRDLALYLGRTVCGLKLDQLARLVGVREYATVAMAVKRFESRLNRRRDLREECQRAKQLLNVKM